MSSLYNLEPQPTAQVLLETTSGEILLELFAKQTPLASRNFLQLCLDGYFTGTIFHRLVPGFIIQGGDPTGTGEGGEAIYDGGLFDDEFHSRLKFNRRGLLGMANSGRKNDNGSQFFLTLGPTPELDGKNTMFGRVAGDTIYNLMKMGEADLVDGQEGRPLYPTRITGAQVLVNPFEEMVRRVGKAKGEVRVEKKEDKKKGKKKVSKTLLSFGVEDGEDEAHVPVKEKFNPKLISVERGAHAKAGMNERPTAAGNGPEKSIKKKRSRSRSPPKLLRPDPDLQLPLPNHEEPSRSMTNSPEPPVVEKVSTLLERTNVQIAEMKASMKRNIPAPPKVEVRKKSALEQMIPENATRGRKRKQVVNGDAPKDVRTLDILNAFRTKLEKASRGIEPSQSPAPGLNRMEEDMHGDPNEKLVPEEEEAGLCDLHFIAHCQSCQSWDKYASQRALAEDDNEEGWLSHALSFEKDRLGKDLSWRRKNEEELVVIDPREKTKDIMEEHRAKKLARAGGNLSRAWDRDRDKGRMPVQKAGERG
jgi:peptidyl-prolyl cis-trans isomerase SDCCAG10